MHEVLVQRVLLAQPETQADDQPSSLAAEGVARGKLKRQVCIRDHVPSCKPPPVPSLRFRRLSDGRTLRATDLLAVSSLLGCWDQPRKLHVCPGRYGIVVGSRVRGRSRDARPGVSSLLPVTCYVEVR